MYVRMYFLLVRSDLPPHRLDGLRPEETTSGPSPTPVPTSASPTEPTQPTSTETQPNRSTPKSPEGGGTEYSVDPEGNPMSLTDALDVAGPGDTISLADGLYREPIVTMNAVSIYEMALFGSIFSGGRRFFFFFFLDTFLTFVSPYYTATALLYHTFMQYCPRFFEAS